MNNKIWYWFFFLCTAYLVVSCNSDENISSINEDQLIEDYLTEMELLDSTLRDNSGIYFQILTENPAGATPSASDILGIYYTANVAGGEIFDANENDGTNTASILHYSTGSVIPVGLDTCLSLLKEGEIGVFYIPPSLAYGDLDDLSAEIPSGSVIQMEIELFSVQSEAEVHDQEINLIDQFIVDYNLHDSIWVDIDTVMTPIDSLWIENINLTTDSVMVPLDSIWYDVTGGAIPVDTVFHFIDSVEFLGSGIYYQALINGIEDTRVEVGEVATIQYELYTLDSYPDNPIDGASQFQFIHQQSVVLNGLDAGIFVMEHNERALLIIPSNQAYAGSVFVIPQDEISYFAENEVIPTYALDVKPFEILVFDVTLFPPQI
ncbi:MAG: FKBP-type peptidyl-prolyl cis-trans isomerase [Reichenbachiella sp.]